MDRGVWGTIVHGFANSQTGLNNSLYQGLSLGLPVVLLLSRFSCVRLHVTPPVDGSPPGSLVPGILQARTLEWVAISFSNA